MSRGHKWATDPAVEKQRLAERERRKRISREKANRYKMKQKKKKIYGSE